MTDTRVSLLEALQDGWSWMVSMLFRPFDVRKWFVVGFAAWLAGLAGWGGGGGGSVSDDDGGAQILHSAQDGWDWLTSHELAAGMIFAGLLTLLALIVAVLWVSSRSKFIFLDNVVCDRAEIVEPWKRFRRQGNSLFAFRLVVALICIPLAFGLIGLCVWLAVGPGGWAHLEGAATVAGVVGTALLGLVLIIATLYTFFFLDAFVVPLMHRYDLGVMDAWRRFLALLGARPGWFLASGLFVFVLCILALVVVLTTGFMTCCLGFLLLAMPYVGTVLLLPLIITYRAFTVAFLGQFDSEVRLGRAGS
ncbi:MAG: hypothetical protein O7A04_05140 [Acidobacteria bacterium]|nr:hypothetical protein [Acidobacteriota bacterium]